ncbi:DUF1127 domain-containing protein [Xanthobacter sp. ZOL 2024]
MSVYGETRRIMTAPVGGALATLVMLAVAGVRQGAKAVVNLSRTLEHRRVISQLAGLDDHMLRDIGITRADLRDAAAEPLGADPTRVLVLRSTERRVAQRLSQWARAGH